MPSPLAGRAFAKVNLGLRILDRRPDGFHELRTVFQSISLADGLSAAWQPGRNSRIELSCDDPALETSENLAWRAAEALLERTGRTGRVRIEIRKRIPAGAGLGGGSSDAAATLRALARLLLPAPPAEALQEVAAGLGSDIPYFLLGGRAAGIGRGQEVYPLPELKRQWFVLVTPDVHVSTAEAYRALAAARPALTLDRKGFILNTFCAGIRTPDGAGAGGASGALTNDFEDIVFQQFPELRQIKLELLRVGAEQALMSGSGSALFGFFGDRVTASKGHAELEQTGLRAHLVRSVSRREFGKWKQAEQKF
jgi:4-diphosphocytidyl-2-C-methyl-D-erythritol kinase